MKIDDKLKIYNKYFKEINREIKLYFGSDDSDCDYYKAPFSMQFYAKHPEFASHILNVQEDLDAMKNLIYQELNKLNISESALAEKCHINKQTLNRILNNKDYKPNRKYIFALAAGLKYNLEQASHLLALAGCSFCYSNPVDIIFYCCLESEIYDIYEINNLIRVAGYNEIIGSTNFER